MIDFLDMSIVLIFIWNDVSETGLCVRPKNPTLWGQIRTMDNVFKDAVLLPSKLLF
jgi:hypothetical protein